MTPDLPSDHSKLAERVADRVANLKPDEPLFDGLLRQIEDPAALVRLHARAIGDGNIEHRAKLEAEMRRRGIWPASDEEHHGR